MSELSAGFDPRRLHHWIAFGFGSGLATWAPGTFGTLAAVPLYWLLQPLSLAAYLALLLVFSGIGVWACGRTARELGSKDPSAIVWDEVVGYLLAMTGSPGGWPWVLAGFVVFRLFDIWKPWPVCVLDQRVTGGLGIILDDLAAGAMAWAVLWLAAAVVGA